MRERLKRRKRADGAARAMRQIACPLRTRGASRSRQKLPDDVLPQNLAAAGDDELADARLSLCRGQQKKGAFYTY